VAGRHRVPVTLPANVADGEDVQLAVRPESVRVGPVPAESDDGLIADLHGTVAEVTFLGNLTDCQVALNDGTRIRFQAGPGDAIEVGQRVSVWLDRESTSAFPS
jgi:hypothetical protein